MYGIQTVRLSNACSRRLRRWISFVELQNDSKLYTMQCDCEMVPSKLWHIQQLKEKKYNLLVTEKMTRIDNTFLCDNVTFIPESDTRTQKRQYWNGINHCNAQLYECQRKEMHHINVSYGQNIFIYIYRLIQICVVDCDRCLRPADSFQSQMQYIHSTAQICIHSKLPFNWLQRNAPLLTVSFDRWFSFRIWLLLLFLCLI